MSCPEIHGKGGAKAPSFLVCNSCSSIVGVNGGGRNDAPAMIEDVHVYCEFSCSSQSDGTGATPA